MLRRLLDILISALGLLVLALPLAVCAVLLKRDSPGPVFYRAPRIGKGGRRFRLWKLRTMVVGADRGSALTEKDDPRVTPFGRFLRQWKIDELPQLINVLTGDLTLVGPRPETPRIVAQYTAEQWEVLSVRPGVTGPSQIRFRDEERDLPPGVDTEEYYLREILPDKIRTDLEYVRTRSLRGDAYCIWLTAIAVGKLSWSFALRGVEMITAIGHRRHLLILLLDAGLSVGSYVLANLLRFEWEIPSSEVYSMWRLLPLLVAIRMTCFLAFGLYRGTWTYASISDLFAIVKAVSAGTGLFVISLMFLDMRRHSRAVFTMDWLILIVLIGATRLSWRMIRPYFNGKRKSGRPVLIIGAGDAGEMVARELQNSPRLKYRPVGFLDDNPDKLGMKIHGIPVLGPVESIGRLAGARGVEEVIIAIPSADRNAMRRIFDLCRQAGLAMKTIPSLGSLLEEDARIDELREVHVEDLLRREPAKLDRELIKAFLRGRRVLVTGAGGSIGSEICRQVAVCEPEILILLDKGENLLFEIDSELAATFPKLKLAPVLADIKHLQPMQQAFARYRPEIVFDAAAFKHVPMMERHPEEAVFNNIVGTRRLAEVSIAHGVRTFVLVSTDKAVNPTSVMGATKRAAEKYVQAIMADPSHGRTALCAVRFGNVLDSSGSVIPTFRKQIERGGPITVTHPDVARYFMTIPEASQLVLRAAGMARGGEIFVLDMGEPVKIHDMACDMIRLSGLEPGKDIEVAVTGLRPGEKLYEELWYRDEDVGQTGQDKLLVVRRPPDTDFITLLPRITKLEELALGGDRTGLIQTLCQVVPEYRSENSELLSRPRILVADDDPATRDLIQGILKDGYDIVFAGDGAEAIAKARERVPDLLLLNLKMPRVNGYSVCQALKADPRTQRTPIIMLTAIEDAAEKARGAGMGADDYVTKPFQAEELRARVQMALRAAARVAPLMADGRGFACS